MYKKILVIILFIITFIFINFKFKITNYVTLNILNKNNIFNSVIVKIDKNIFNNQVISTIDIKTDIEYKENYIYKVNIKINEITVLDYIFNYVRGKK